MAGEEQNKPETTKSGLSGFGIIEKIGEWNWALRFTSIVIFVDIALILRSGEGVLNWSAAGHEKLLSNLGLLAVSVAFLGLFVTLFLPILEMLALFIYCNVYLRIFPLTYDQNDHRRPYGHVLADKVLERALREGNDFMLREYKEHQARKASDDAFRIQAGRLISGTLLLAATDLLLSMGGRVKSSLISSSIQYLGTLGEVVAYLIAFMGVCLLCQIWFRDPPKNWMYYPPLADEEAAKEWEAHKGMPGYWKRDES